MAAKKTSKKKEALPNEITVVRPSDEHDHLFVLLADEDSGIVQDGDIVGTYQLVKKGRVRVTTEVEEF